MEQPSAPTPPSENSLIKERRDKLAKLREKGIDPFKNKFTPDHACNEARSGFESGVLPEGTKVSVAGRITAHREMGKSMFIDVRDQSGRIQIYAQKNVLGDEPWNIFTHLDLGDFIGVTGTLFRTKTGEPSLKLEAFTILAKALRPPPAKWHGLEDTEIRYRQRYLDLMGNPEVKDVFLKRSAIVHEIRSFFHGRGYVEVETPAMQAIPGGAAAQPFKTFHNALGCDFYLRIALELYHKRLLVGGIDKLFEIGKNFRNEGLSRRHNPEFTMLEAYCAFGDYESMMETVEALITGVAEKVVGTLCILNKCETDVPTQLELALSAVERAYEAADGVNRTMVTERWRSWLNEAREEMRSLILSQGSMPKNEAASRGRQIIGRVDRRLMLDADDMGLDFIKANTDYFGGPLTGFRRTIQNLGLLAREDINLSRPWKRVRYKDLIREKVRNDWYELSLPERLAYAEDVLGVEVAGRPRRKINQILSRYKEHGNELYDLVAGGIALNQLPDSIQRKFDEAAKELSKGVEYFEHGVQEFEVDQAVFEKLIEPTLIQPTFVTHLPKELVPLAKLSPDDPTTVEVFECCINGQEIAPGYTEQNDPIQQRQTLEHQAGGEQQKLDEDFLVALEHGMPPAGGIGIGIDRLCMMLLGQESIRDVILFPQLKPK
jgi:lysyl-tRNA synthetase